MKHLIDKDALVVLIEKCYNECLKKAKITDSDYWNGKADAYRNVLAILSDTLEVKEVDLEKELGILDNAHFEFNGIMVNGTTIVEELKIFAKHFFELGLSVSNKA